MVFGRSRSSLAVDIGSGLIKMVVLDTGKDRPRIVSLGVEPMPPDAIVGGEVMDYHLVAETIRRLRDRLGLKGRDVATSVSGRDVIVKRIKMDRMQEQEAQQVIRWEAEQHVPFDMDSVSLDFEILDPGEEGLQMDVLLVAAKMDLIETRKRLLEEAGFEATTIDLDAFAVQRAFERNYEHAAYGTFCLVNVGREITNLNLIQDGRPLLTRDVAVGERRCAEALVKELDLPLEEAESILRSGEELAPGSREAVDEAFEGILTPVERARAFLSTADGEGDTLDEVVLAGGGADLPGLAGTIEQRLGTAVTTLDPLRSVDIEPDAQETIVEQGSPCLLAVAVGLGLRDRE